MHPNPQKSHMVLRMKRLMLLMYLKLMRMLTRKTQKLMLKLFLPREEKVIISSIKIVYFYNNFVLVIIFLVRKHYLFIFYHL